MVRAPPELRQGAAHEPLYEVDPRTGATIEVFYADRTLETFGRCGAGWFWCFRVRGSSPVGPATGPFAPSYAAYRHAMMAAAVPISSTPRECVQFTKIDRDQLETPG